MCCRRFFLAVWVLGVFSAVWLAACGGEKTGPAPAGGAPDAGTALDPADTGDMPAPDVSATGGGSAAPPKPERSREWNPGLVPTDKLTSPRGLRRARGIIHLHSPYSHDACDGQGRREDGSIDLTCLANLRRALCVSRQDYAMLTDHRAYVDSHPFEQLLLIGEGDKLITREGSPYANQMTCGDRPGPVLMVGSENDLMPVGLHRHVGSSKEEIGKILGGSSKEAAEVMIKNGALVFRAHSESKPLEWFRALPLTGMEVYNLHANIDPRIRPEHLGLDSTGGIKAMTPFLLEPEKTAHPDLAFLAFVLPNDNALGKWHTLIGERQMVATAGTDAHENVLQGKLSDGERGDSFRRLLHWFSNTALVDSLEPDAIKSAIGGGRMYIAFEALGTPDRFDFHAIQGGKVAEMGSVLKLQEGNIRLNITAPRLADDVPGGDNEPEIRAELIRVEGGKAEVIAQSGDEIAFDVRSAGAYYVRVMMTPRHYEPFMGPRPKTFMKEYTWIHSNPVYVR